MAKSLRDSFDIPPGPEVTDEQLEAMAAMPAMVPVDWCPTHQRYVSGEELQGDGCLPCVLEVLRGGNPLTAPDTWRGS